MTTTTMPEAIGRTIKARREMLGMTMPQLGEAVARLTGNQSWANRALIYQAEGGKRALTATELVAIAHVLRMRSWTLLLVDPLTAQEVDLGGERVSLDALQPLGDIPDPDSAAQQLSEVHTLASQFSDQAEAATASVAKARTELEKVRIAYEEALVALGDAHGTTEGLAEGVGDLDWMLTKLNRDVARYAHGSTTTQDED